MTSIFFSRVQTSFSNYGKAGIEKFTRTVVENMTNDKQFARFSEDVEKLNIIFQNYLNTLKTGGEAKRVSDIEVSNARKELDEELEVVGSFVNGLARGNRLIILKAGFEGSVPPEPITRVEMPVINQIERTENPENRLLKLKKAEGVKIFQVRYRYDEDTEYQFLCATTKLKTKIGPFEIGRTVWIQVCGLGARDLMTEWTAPESFVAVK